MVESYSYSKKDLSTSLQATFQRIAGYDNKKGISHDKEANDLALLLSGGKLDDGTTLSKPDDINFVKAMLLKYRESHATGDFKKATKEIVDTSIKKTVDTDQEVEALLDIVNNEDNYNTSDVAYAKSLLLCSNYAQNYLKMNNMTDLISKLVMDNQELTEEVEDLTASNAILQAENEDLTTSNTILQAENNELKAANDELIEQNVNLETENKSLRKKNELLEQQLSSMSNSRANVASTIDGMDIPLNIKEDLKEAIGDLTSTIQTGVRTLDGLKQRKMESTSDKISQEITKHTKILGKEIASKKSKISSMLSPFIKAGKFGNTAAAATAAVGTAEVAAGTGVVAGGNIIATAPAFLVDPTVGTAATATAILNYTDDLCKWAFGLFE